MFLILILTALAFNTKINTKSLLELSRGGGGKSKTMLQVSICVVCLYIPVN